MEERGIFSCFVIIVFTYLLSRIEAGTESGYCDTGNNELSYDFEDEKCSRHSLFTNKRLGLNISACILPNSMYKFLRERSAGI